MIAEASARMLVRATVCAIAKIGPRWKPTRKDPSASAVTIKAKLGVRKHSELSKAEVAMLIGHIDRLTEKAARMLADEKDLS